MNKRHAVRMLKYALRVLESNPTLNHSIYVCNAMDTYVDQRCGSQYDSLRRTRKELREWVISMITETTFGNFFRFNHNTDLSEVQFNKLRIIWVREMIDVLVIGEYHPNNKTPIEAVIKYAKKSRLMK